MDELASRIAVLESRIRDSAGIGSDLRVIEMQISRAEEKVLRMGRGASWTRPGLSMLMTGDAE